MLVPCGREEGADGIGEFTGLEGKFPMKFVFEVDGS